jgi:hypothetical protein
MSVDKEIKMETTQEKPKAKRQRKPVGFSNRLEILNADSNRSYRLINNDPARLAQFEQAGYRVEDVKTYMYQANPGTKGASVDNVFHAGGGQKQVLVSIERELWEEDQAAKQAKIDATESQMKRKTADGLQDFYGDVKIQRT